MTADYTNTAQQRLLRVLMAMFSDVFAGVAPKALAHAAGCSPSAITRDLHNLQRAGLAVRDERTGLWRLTPVLPRQAVKVWAAVARHGTALDAARRDYGTGLPATACDDPLN